MLFENLNFLGRKTNKIAAGHFEKVFIFLHESLTSAPFWMQFVFFVAKEEEEEGAGLTDVRDGGWLSGSHTFEMNRNCVMR